MKKLFVQTQMADADAATLQGKILDSSRVKYVIGGESATVVSPEGDVLAILIKDALPNKVCSTAQPFLLKSATANVIGSFRGTASSTKMEHPVKKDGTISKMLEVPDVPRLRGAKNGVLGYMDKSNLNPCRTTSYTRDHWVQFSTTVMPYVQAVDQVFQAYMPERWAAQKALAMTTPDYTITGTSRGL